MKSKKGLITALILLLLLLTACSTEEKPSSTSALAETQLLLSPESQTLPSQKATEGIPNESVPADASSDTKDSKNTLDLQDREDEIKSGLILPLNNGEPLTAEINFHIDLVKGRNEKAEWVSIRQAEA